MQLLLGLLLGNINHQDDTVIAVKHTVYAITWLALNQMVFRFIHDRAPIQSFLCSLSLRSLKINPDHSTSGMVPMSPNSPCCAPAQTYNCILAIVFN